MSSDGLDDKQKRTLDEVDRSLDTDDPPSPVVARIQQVTKQGADALTERGEFPLDPNTSK